MGRREHTVHALELHKEQNHAIPSKIPLCIHANRRYALMGHGGAHHHGHRPTAALVRRRNHTDQRSLSKHATAPQLDDELRPDWTYFIRHLQHRPLTTDPQKARKNEIYNDHSAMGTAAGIPHYLRRHSGDRSANKTPNRKIPGLYGHRKNTQRINMSDQKTPKISVVIPAYNEVKKIRRCLTALQKQSIRDPYEIIVVDNGSSDDTAPVARKFGVTVLEEKTRGVACARQRGFQAARGDIIASTDADTIVPPDWLQTIQNAMADPKRVGVMGTFLFYDRGKIWNGLTKIITPAIRFIDWIVGHGQNHFIGMNFAVRKEAFRKSAGFNTNLKYR